MSGEIKELLAGKLTRKTEKHERERKKVALTIELQELIDNTLTNPTDSLVIEVTNKEMLPSFLEILESPQLKGTYNIQQAERTDDQYIVTLKSIDL